MVPNVLRSPFLIFYNPDLIVSADCLVVNGVAPSQNATLEDDDLHYIDATDYFSNSLVSFVDNVERTLDAGIADLPFSVDRLLERTFLSPLPFHDDIKDVVTKCNVDSPQDGETTVVLSVDQSWSNVCRSVRMSFYA